MGVSAWLLFHYYDRFWYPPDEGNYAHVAQRMLNGEILNLQVQDLHPGYINFVNAGALALFGPDLLSLRYPLVVAGLLQAALLFFVFPRRDPWRAAAASVGLTALSAIQFLNPTAHWYCLSLVVLLVYVLDRWPRTARRLLLVGFLIGTIALFRQLTGFLVGIGALAYLLSEARDLSVDGRQALLGRAIQLGMLLALCIYLLLATDVAGVLLFGLWPLIVLCRLLLQPQAPTRAAVRLAGWIACGAILAAIPMLSYHLVHGSLMAWGEDVGPAAVALTRLSFFDRSNFAALVFHGYRQVAEYRDLASVLNGVYWTTLPLLAAINGAVILRLMNQSARPAIAALPVIATFYAVVSVHFQIPVYLYYTAGLSLASLLWLTPHISPAASRAAVWGALFLAGTGVYFHAGQPASRGIAAVLRGDRMPASVLASLPHCSLKVDPDERAQYGTLLAIIQRVVAPNESIFAVPSNAELYFFSDRRNEFRFYNTALGVRDEAELAVVQQTLRERPPKLVTFNPGDKYNTPMSWRIMDGIKSRYVLIRRLEPFEVYVRDDRVTAK
jgi:hypothetical protein